MNMKHVTKSTLPLAALAMAGLAFTTAMVHSQELLAVDIGGGPVESGFVGQSTSPATHTTTAGDVTVAFSGQQGFFNFAPPNTTGSNVDFYQDFVFKNGGTITMIISGPGISASTDYVLSFWTQYQEQPRNTTFDPSAGTTGPSLGPIANTNFPATGLDDPEHFISGTYTSDGSGMLTILVGGTNNRPALNGLKIETVGGGPADPQITSITSVGGGVWELTLDGDADTAYEFRSSTNLDFSTAPLVENLMPGVPAVGTIGGSNDSVLTTDSNGDGKVQVTLAGPANFVVAQIPPPLFSEDFESGAGGFTLKVAGGPFTPVGSVWEHGTPDSTSPGGVVDSSTSSQCMGTNIGPANTGWYDVTTETCLHSSVIDLNGVTAAELTFAEALDLDAGDTAVVNIIEELTDTVLGTAVYTADDSTEINDANWLAVPAIDLTAYVGQKIRVEWCLSGTAAEYMGWYIDDVVVTDTTP